MEDEGGHPPRPERRFGGGRVWESEFWKNSVFTLSYWFFELVCFAALLSMSIGISALVAVANEYFLQQKLSIFLQTYVTMFVLYNFGNIQARHQIVYIFPLRRRFGNQAKYCFACNYPCSTSFFILLISYINLFFQFSNLLCPWELFRDNYTPNLRGSSSDSLLIQENREKFNDRNFEDQSHSKKDNTDGNDESNWSVTAFGAGVVVLPDVGLTTTTALYLLSLCTIQYLTCRKLRWDFYLEASRIQHPPVFPSCSNFLYALFILLFIQLVLTALYTMPILLWLLLSKQFQWHLSTILLTTVSWSLVIGFMGAFVERQEPFPTVNHSRLYQLVNLKLRSYLVCLAYIPGLFYWFIKMEEISCVVIPFTNPSPETNFNLTSSQSQSPTTTPLQINIFNFFLLNVSLCIISTTKYTLLSCTDRQDADPLNFNNLHHRHHPANVLGGAARVGHIHQHLQPHVVNGYLGNDHAPPPLPGEPLPPIARNTTEVNNNQNENQPQPATTPIQTTAESLRQQTESWLQPKTLIGMSLDIQGNCITKCKKDEKVCYSSAEARSICRNDSISELRTSSAASNAMKADVEISFNEATSISEGKQKSDAGGELVSSDETKVAITDSHCMAVSASVVLNNSDADIKSVNNDDQLQVGRTKLDVPISDMDTEAAEDR